MPDENKAQEGNSLETLVSEIKTQVSGALEKVNGVPDEDAIRSMVQEELQTQAAKNSPKDGTNAGAPAIAQFAEARKFDNLSFGELAFAHKVLATADKTPEAKLIEGKKVEGPSPNMTFALAARAMHDGQTYDSTWAVREQMKKQRISRNVSDMKAWAGAYTAFHKSFPREEFKNAMKSEVERSTLAGFGEEWAGVAYSNALWETIEIEARVLPQMPTLQLPAGVESMVLPLEGAAPTFYRVAQATSQAANPGYTDLTVTTSRLGTENVMATVEKIGAGVTWASEITEDLIVMFAPILFASLAEEAGHTFDSMCINSDQDTDATNINTGAAINDATRGNPDTKFVGFRKASLDTKRHMILDATPGGAANPKTFETTDIMDLIPLFGQNGAEGMDPRKVSLISNVGLDFSIRKSANVINRDYRFYTVTDSMVTHIYGYPYFCSIDFARQSANLKTATTGKISATASNNTANNLLAVRWDQWLWVMKRMMTMEIERVARADAYELTMLTRVGITSRAKGSRAVQLINFA